MNCQATVKSQTDSTLLALVPAGQTASLPVVPVSAQLHPQDKGTVGCRFILTSILS